MVKHTQTIRRQIANANLEICVLLGEYVDFDEGIMPNFQDCHKTHVIRYAKLTSIFLEKADISTVVRVTFSLMFC